MQTPHELSSWQQQRTEQQQRHALENIIRNHRTMRGREPIPIRYQRPAYNTPEYYRDVSRGWISEHEQRADHADYEARRRRALDSKHNRAKTPHRHQRQAPTPSRQFAKCMSTKAARDDRLTPQSKALLQVIVARAGKGRSTDTTKSTLGKIMNRCPRSVQRYIRELVQFGYLRTQTLKSRRSGFYIGLRIWIMNCVLPFWAEGQGNDAYNPEKWVRLAAAPGNREKTELSLTKIKYLYEGVIEKEEPPWRREYAWR